MPFPSVTYTFTNSTTADATQVNQDFTDIINGISDGTKNISVSAGTFAGTVNCQAAVTLGASSSNAITWNGALASSIPIQTTNTYDIGSDSLGLRSIYFGSGSSAHSTRLIGASVTSAWTMTLPLTAGSNLQMLQTDGTGVTTWTTLRKTADFASNYSLNASVAANAMTVALKDQSGSDPSGTSTVDVLFRSATATTGQPQLVSISAAASVVIPSGATLGLNSGQNTYIYVYLVQDSTNELAVSGSRAFDENSLQSCTAITSGSTSANTLYSTSTHTSRPIRYIGRILSNQTVSGTYASAPTEISSSFYYKACRSEVYVDSGNGHGATNTKIRRWTNTRKNVGGAITYADSSNNGGSFTVNEDGIYAVTASDQYSGGQEQIAITVNDSAMTTNAGTPITWAQGLRASAVTPGSGINACVQWTGACFVGDVIRLHDAGRLDATNALSSMSVVKVSD